MPRRWESWGKPGRTGDHPKSWGGGRPSGCRLPRSPPPPSGSPPTRSRGVPSSRELRPVPGGSRGSGAGGLGPARGKLRRGAAGLAPGPAGGEASGVWGAKKRPGHGRRSRRSGAGRGEEEGGGTPQLSARASLARQPGAPPSLPRWRSEPCPQRQSLNESETRGCRRRAGTGRSGGEHRGAAGVGRMRQRRLELRR